MTCLFALMVESVAGMPIHKEDTVKDNRPTAYTTMSWDDFVQAQSENAHGMDSEEWQQYMEQLEWLHSHPLDINSATPDEMAQLPFLTPAQVEAVQAYVHLDGPMKSLGELALIPALDFLTRQVMPLFFYVAPRPAAVQKGNWPGRMKHSVDTRMDVPLYSRRGNETGAYSGDGLYHRMRYTLESKHLAVGARVEKDAGEAYYDSYGAYAMVSDHGILRSAIVGDYRAGWGEGLVLGRGGYYGKDNMMSSKSSGIRPMTGMAESGFLRGVAVTLGSPAKTQTSGHRHGIRLSGTLLASYQAVDATLTEEGEVRTLVTSGYHRTEAEREKRGNTHTAIVGGHVQADMGHFHLGATGYWQHFDRVLSPGDAAYRRWYPRGSDFGVMGMHGAYSSYRWTASAEVAYSTNHRGVAALGRVLWLVNRNLKLGVLGRHYGHRYHSFQSAAMAEGSRAQNETGGMLRLEARPWNKLSLVSYVDFFSDHWPRHGMSMSSRGQELMAEARWDAATGHTLSLRYKMKRKADNDIIIPRHRLRAQWAYFPSTRWRLQSTATVNVAPGQAPGFAFSQLVRGKMLHRDALNIAVMGAYFYARDYLTRVYIYEPSLWNSTSLSSSYYGHGLRLTAILRYTSRRSRWMVEAKYALTHMLDRGTIGSALQEILSPTRQDISVQVRMTY